MRENKHYLPKQRCISLLLAATFLQLAAQNPRVEYLTIADGLSQGMIYDIEQTDDGFLWFATKDGLNRYDGYHFEVFTNDPFNPFSIAGNDIFGMFEDSRGNLWLSLYGKGVDVLEKNSGRFLHLPSFLVEGEPWIPGIVAETPDGTIWACTANGLLRLRWKNPGKMDINNSDLQASLSVEVASRGKVPGKTAFFDLAANPDGSLIISSVDDGIYKFTPADGQLRLLLPIPELALPLWKSIPGRVWTSFNGKVFVVENGGSAREISLGNIPKDRKLTRIFNDGKGNLLWVSTSYTQGSQFFSAPEDEVLRSGSAGQPTLIYANNTYTPCSEIDRSGNLWISTNGYGLQKLNLSPLPFQHLLAGRSILDLLIGDEIYFTIFAKGGCERLDEPTNLPQPTFNFPPDSWVYSICYAKKSATWYFTGTSDPDHFFLGIKKGSKTELRSIQPVNQYSPLIEDRKGRLWTGAEGGRLMCILSADNSLAYFDFSKQMGSNADVYALLVDESQNMWVGTTNGILKLEMEKLEIRAGQIIYNFPIAQFQTISSDTRSLRHNFVTNFCPDPLEPQRYLWVSTKGGGLNLLDKSTGEFQHFTNQNSGLPNDVVYGMLPDFTPLSGGAGGVGNIWCSTNRGLSRLTVVSQSPTATRTYHFRNFREFDGLQSDEFNTGSFDRAPDGRLLFGGVNGLTAFYPSQITDRKSDAQVLITGLKINNLPENFFIPLEGGRGVTSPLNRPIHRTTHLRLDHTQNLVTLEFALMDFVLPKENRFRYRLQGVDPDWVEAGTSHVANYARLRPGNYFFEVQGSIGGGEWSAPTSLRITILPPWSATWWAYTLYVLALGGALFLFYKNRLRQKLEHQESLRLRELDEFKSRFFTNVTHEFRTPLTVILGTAEQVEPKVGEEIKGKIGLIRRNGLNLLRLINQILDLAKLENKSLKINYVQGDVLPYLRYVAESLQSLANAQNVMLRVESDQAKIEMDYDPERLLQIVHNLISNAIKFTPSGGKVTLRADKDLAGFQNLPSLNLTVTDTGVGIPPEDLPKIFDRFFQADNLEKAKAGGTGIGLSLTRELVKAMGGEISVESEVGKGTTFTFRLPITNKAAASDGVTSSHAVTSAVPKVTPFEKVSPLSTEQPALLVIEDNPDVVEYLAACLSENYQLDFAYNGRAGIEKALETVPDLIISDVMMPEKDGFEVCDFLKNDERTSHIPIILLTAKADVESRIAGLKRGADAYLAKPFHQEELTVTLANLLELRRKLQLKYATVPATSVAEPEPISAVETAGTVDLENEFLKKLTLCIGENLGDTAFDGSRLARAMKLSEVQLYRKIKALTDKSTAIFIRSIRLARGRELLQTTSLNVSEIAYEVGFDDPNYFSRTFSQEFGAAPSEVRK